MLPEMVGMAGRSAELARQVPAVKETAELVRQVPGAREAEQTIEGLERVIDPESHPGLSATKIAVPGKIRPRSGLH